MFDVFYIIFYALYGIGILVFLIMLYEILIRQLENRKDMTRLSSPNDKLMLIFGLGVVISWVTIAATASYFSIVEEREITDSQLTVIGLLGGPALLMITSVLDLFKGKEGAKINILPEQLASDVNATETEKEHIRLIEKSRIDHDLKMEEMQKAHELKMDAYITTHENTELQDIHITEKKSKGGKK